MGFFSRKDRALKRLRDVAGVDDIPHFPASMTRILAKLHDPETSMAEIAEEVSWDPGLTVRLIKLVNSAAFGLRREVDSVQHAITLLGRANVEALVLGLAVGQILPRDPAPGFDSKRYWLTAARRASLARNLSEKLDPSAQAVAFTLGLLQDMAVPVLAHAKPREYGPILTHWHGSKDASLEQLESEALGWSHADLGATIGEAWDLPENLVAGIRSHHPSADAEGGNAAVHLVSLMREGEEQAGIEALVEEGRASFGLDPDWTRDAIERADAQAAELAHLMS